MAEKGEARRGAEAWVLLAAALVAAVILWGPLFLLSARGVAVGPQAGEAGAAEPVPAWMLPFDDAYIFVRFAQQAARGRPFQWTDGEPSTGSSSFVFPFLLAPGALLGGDVAAWSWWLRGVGLLGLWLAGLAAARVLRALGLPRPWPTAGGLAVVWSGPVAFSSLGGMETGLAIALLLYLCARWMEAEKRRQRAPALWLGLALLPLVRPELAVVTGLAAAGAFLGWGPPLGRTRAPLLLLPGLALAAFNLALTGEAQPAGALGKSIFTSPFAGPLDHLGSYLGLAGDVLAPVYAGLHPRLLPPPVGWLALAVGLASLGSLGLGVLRRRAWLRELRPLAVVWALLVLMAPISGYLAYQELRHHHAGLVCAWLLALAGLAHLAGGLARHRARHRNDEDAPEPLAALARSRLRWLVLLVPMALLPGLWGWATLYLRGAVDLHLGNGLAARWLARQGGGERLVLNDAGLLALGHDGPMVDVVGLGTGRYLRPFRNGTGSVVEQLARERPLPRLAAVNGHVLDRSGLLGRPSIPVRELLDRFEREWVVVTELRLELLERTALEGPGVDFTYLPSERAAELLWRPPPWQQARSAVLHLAGAGGREESHGCRPLRERLGIGLEAGHDRLRLRAAAQPGHEGRLRAYLGERAGPAGEPIAELALPAGSDAWQEVEIPLPPGAADAGYLWLENAGDGAPCLESLAYVGRGSSRAGG